MNWIKNMLKGVIGILETVVKASKEISTVILDILSIVPQVEIIIISVRGFCNNIYSTLSDWKEALDN